jgi:biotin operon repressor
MTELDAQTQWFHFFRAMVESGDLAKMDGSVIKIYLIVKAHVNFTSGNAFPSIETLSAKAGMSERQVMRAIATLEGMGYISKVKKGRNNIYTLREKIDIVDDVGDVTAVASWDYAPSTIQNAVADLKNVLLTGDLAGAKIVHIENLHVNIQNNGIQMNNTATNQLVDTGALKELLSKEAFDKLTARLGNDT